MILYCLSSSYTLHECEVDSFPSIFYYFQIEQANEYAYKRRLERKLWAVNYLGNKCSKCGITYPHYVYDFHHKNPKEKEFAISLILYYSEESLKKELDKCALLCANCHREEHWGAI